LCFVSDWAGCKAVHAGNVSGWRGGWQEGGGGWRYLQCR
jgi:hypothetical protein